MPIPTPLRSTAAFICLLPVLSLSVASCEDEGLGVADVAEVAVAGGEGQQAVVGETVAPIRVLVTTADGTPVGGVPVGWTTGSNSGTVAQAETTTDGEGLASNSWTLGATAGDQTVQATVGTVTPAVFTATARPGPPATVQVSPEALTLQSLGETNNLIPTVRDAFDNEIPGVTLQWSSSDEAVASVDATGQVEATGNGSATITAATGAVTGATSISVDQVATSVSVTPPTLTLEAIQAAAQLSAEATDANGNPLADATFDWTSSDETVVTVDAQGRVESVDNGSTTVNAAVQNSSGSGAVTVDQVPASVTVTPDTALLEVGDQVALTAEARDANDFPISAQTFEWASSDEAVATVDESGTVTGESAGQAEVTARAADAEGRSTVQVSPPVFEPASDTAISGNVTLASMSIPANVTVTLEGDAVVDVEGDAIIQGTITGDCVDLKLTALGSLTIRGTVSTVCSGSPGATPPVLEIGSAGNQLFENAVIDASHDLIIGPAQAPAGTGTAALVALAQERCTYRNTTAGSARPLAGFDELGLPASRLEVECQGDLISEGSIFQGRNGAAGSDRSASGSATGGDGQDAGTVMIRAVGSGKRILFRGGAGGPSRIVGGDGGRGGHGTATGEEGRVADVVARGGNGGRNALIHIRADVLVFEPGGLAIHTGSGGDGGNAEALGGDGFTRRDGDDVTLAPTDAARVVITPGNGGSARNRSIESPLIDALPLLVVETGKSEGVEHITLVGGRAGNGGNGTLRPGRGGHDLRTTPIPPGTKGLGGRGGGAFFEVVGDKGGNGGDANLWDLRSSAPLRFPIAAGRGSTVTVTGGMGGNGFSDCRVGAFAPGGAGGRGGFLTADLGGLGGQLPDGTPGETGRFFISSFANGGRGGDGVNTLLEHGLGGAAGGMGSIAPDRQVVQEPAFRAGADGSPCRQEHDVDVSVQSDPSGHEEFVGMTGVTSLSHEIGHQEVGGQMVPVVSVADGAGPWVLIEGPLELTGNFDLAGSGTVAGFPNIQVTMSGSLVVGQEGQADPADVGRVIGFEGTLIVGSEGGLPGGQPATYDVSATKKEGGSGG